MKKASLLMMISLLVLINGLAFAGSPKINESLANGRWFNGYESLNLEIKAQQVNPSSTITWKAENVGGMSAFHVSVEAVSSGNATTINAQQTMSDGSTTIGSGATITEGTAFTDIEGGFYTFTYNNNVATTTNVTINFMISD